MRRLTLFSIGVSLLFVLDVARAQQVPQTHEATQVRHDGEADAIRETVFRFVITLRNWNAANSRVFFLGIDPGNHDPSHALLQRFAEQKPPVQPISQAARVAPRRIKGQVGSKYAVEFRIGPIDWITATQVQVQASDWAGPKMAMSGTFRVRKQNNRWVVRKTQKPLRMSSLVIPALQFE